MSDRNQIVVEYISHLRSERGLSAHSVEAYARDLREFVELTATRGRDAATAGRADLFAYQACLQRQGRRPATVARKLAAVRGLLGFAHREGVRCDPPPEPERMQVPRSLPRALTPEELGRLLSAPDVTDPEGLRDRALLELLYSAGLRVTELLSLRPADVRNQERLVRVLGKGGRERLVPVGAPALRWLQRYLDKARPLLATVHPPAEERLFLDAAGRSLSRTAFWKRVRNYAHSACISGVVSPHTLRHTFATHLLAGGADLRSIQELLGHADIGTTQIYTHVDDSHLGRVFRQCHPRA